VIFSKIVLEEQQGNLEENINTIHGSGVDLKRKRKQKKAVSK
jgi:hypothetical protein